VRLANGVLFTPDGEALLTQLARYVLDHRIPLELAPTCNVQIGAVPTIADHPIASFLRLGFCATVNTDNRLMSNVSPSSELHIVATTFDLSWDEVAQLVTNGVNAAFAPYELRKQLIADVIEPGYAALSV
jgi:adenosine deaminase